MESFTRVAHCKRPSSLPAQLLIICGILQALRSVQQPLEREEEEGSMKQKGRSTCSFGGMVLFPNLESDERWVIWPLQASHYCQEEDRNT
jgi:hypothetical protein